VAGAGSQADGQRRPAKDLAAGRQWDNGRMAGNETGPPSGNAGQVPDEAPRRPRARDLNELIRYTMWSVFRVRDPAALDSAAPAVATGETGRAGLAAEITQLCGQAAEKGVITRGCYDMQGMRADADYMFWWIAPSSDDLQEMYARFRRTGLGRASEPVWSVLALHRPAEFNKSHVPAFLADEEPRGYICVYPFVRSYEWYLLGPEERRALLAEHGMMAREYPDVRANTVSCFALNDYEWMLAFEADELHRIVDLMRHLRGARARLHTRVEIPFYTGRRKPVRELLTALP
jgi:chlorite dismutase